MNPVILNNRYELLSKMGIGGMAYVYKAKDKALNRIVAIKTLKDEYAQDKDFIKRFKDEALSVAKLSHESIVNVYDVGYDNNMNYIVMECVEGTTLSNYLESAGPLDIKEVVDISMQIFAALEHAHNNGYYSQGYQTAEYTDIQKRKNKSNRFRYSQSDKCADSDHG